MYRNHKYVNSTAPVVSEYLERERLSKLGFTSSLDHLPADKGAALIYISAEFDRLKHVDLEKQRKKAKRR